jgi:LacI family transcriptional regulator
VDASVVAGVTGVHGARRVTLSDVAARAGVSRATASLVVRGEGALAETTRERVRAAMDELGYVYNRGAAALRASSTQSIGLVVPDVSNDFTAELTVTVENNVGGFVTLIGNSLEDLDRQDALVRSMIERQVDGMIVLPAVGTTDRLVAMLTASRVPVVMATREMRSTGLPYVGIDNLLGGRLAADHLLGHGARRVAYIGGLEQLRPRRDRVAGARRALVKAGGELVADIPGPPRGSWGRDIARELIASGQLPDAIICHNDLVAFGVYRALRERGLGNPHELPIVSYDDIAAAELWEPPLTSVGASGYEVGMRCAEALLRRMAAPQDEAERILVSPHLVVRESCGCVVDAR